MCISRPTLFLTRLMSASLLILLTACAPSIENVAPPPPDATDDLKACTAALVPDVPGAPGTGLSKEQSADAIGDQRAAAFAKDRCTKSWAAFYEDVRKVRTPR